MSVNLRLMLDFTNRKRNNEDLSKDYKKDLLFTVNNLNARRNNVDPLDVDEFNERITEMEPDELEGLDDDSHDMHAAALLLLERREHVDDESKRLTEYQVD